MTRILAPLLLAVALLAGSSLAVLAAPVDAVLPVAPAVGASPTAEDIRDIRTHPKCK